MAARRENENEEFMATINEFMESTSAHGFSHVKHSRHARTKLFWVLILLTSFAGLGFHLSTLVCKYLAFDHEETTELVHESPVFPDVTICNMDGLSSDRFVLKIFCGICFLQCRRKLLDLSSFCRLWTSDPENMVGDFFNLVRKENWEAVNKNATENGFKPLHVGVIMAQAGMFANWPRDYLKSIGYQFYDLFVKCTFAGQTCNESDFRVYVHAEYLNCYTFQLRNAPYIRAGPEAGLTVVLYIGKCSYPFCCQTVFK